MVAIAMNPTVVASSALAIRNHNGTDAVAAIEASETKRETAKTIAKVPSATHPAIGDTAIVTPNAVATPFPPLRYGGIEKQCPNTTAAAAHITNHW